MNREAACVCGKNDSNQLCSSPSHLGFNGRINVAHFIWLQLAVISITASPTFFSTVNTDALLYANQTLCVGDRKSWSLSYGFRSRCWNADRINQKFVCAAYDDNNINSNNAWQWRKLFIKGLAISSRSQDFEAVITKEHLSNPYLKALVRPQHWWTQ